jgi:heme oxygenase
VQRLSRTLIQLNIATRPHHAEADQPWVDLMAPRIDPSHYRALLLTAYGFEAPLDSAFRYTPELWPLIDLRGRTRSGLIAQDLMRLELTASQIAQLPQRFTTFSTAAEALGWMYVIERSTLLHSSVRRHIMQRCPELASATSYLDAYNGVTSLRWAELGAAFDSLAHTPATLRQILNGANAGFRAMREWFRNLVLERSSRLKHSLVT